MTQNQVRARFHAEAKKHGLPDDWSFRFDNAKVRAGCCRYRSKIISISRGFIKKAPDQEIVDTILHEIAHALVGRGHGHGPVWRRKARDIGCSARRCHDIRFTEHQYRWNCRNCERGEWARHRLPRRLLGRICPYCRSEVHFEIKAGDAWESYAKWALRHGHHTGFTSAGLRGLSGPAIFSAVPTHPLAGKRIFS